MPRQLRDGQVPPGGYAFTDADGVEHRARTFPALVHSLTNYRRMNQFPPGDPAAEMTEYFCDRHPNICTRAASRLTAEPSNFATRVQGWIANRYARVDKQGLPRVGSRESITRASICAGCPQNVVWTNPCKPCEADFRRRAYVIRAGEHVPNEDALDGCQLIGQCNKTAVWLDEPKSTVSGLPSFCWRALGGDKA